MVELLGVIHCYVLGTKERVCGHVSFNTAKEPQIPRVHASQLNEEESLRNG